MHINRQPPSGEALAEHLGARLARTGVRKDIDTIPVNRGPCPSCTARRDRSLKHCHMPAAQGPGIPPRETAVPTCLNWRPDWTMTAI
jgi:hypothetical protein